MSYDGRIDPTLDKYKIQMNTSKVPADGMQSDIVQITDKQNNELIEYLLCRLQHANQKRTTRIQRYAKVDQLISTWQKLSPEDSKRDVREENTGKLQALPMNLPIAAAHIDDAVAYYAEVFAPLGGNFYQNPSKQETTAQMKELVRMMNEDTQLNQYYMHVCKTMRALNKYNFGGFHVSWTDGDPTSVGGETQPGNVVESLDMYNFIYDEEVKDMDRLHKEAEYAARIRNRSRLWLLKQWRKGKVIRVDKVVGLGKAKAETGSNNPNTNSAKFYKNPPANTRMEKDGQDTRTSDQDSGHEVDWHSYGLSLDSDVETEINGHEIIHMYCWINPNQFELTEDDEDSLELWEFTICDAVNIINLRPVPEATEIPIYVTRMNIDDMKEAARSIAEYLRPFQRFVSFLMNTHIEGIKGSVWGLKAIDPNMFDPSTIKNGETSGLLVSKKPGSDVRSGFMQLQQNNSDTRQNMQDTGVVMDLMKQFFPNQAIPAQVAGMDRAVNSQVAAVMQSGMRKMIMMTRLVDSSLMLPTRMAQYRNIALYDPDKAMIKNITEAQVANLLNSGLGQIGREAAAESVRSVLFAIIQNQEAMGTFDVPGLFTLWSQLLNLGTDLGDFAKQPVAAAVDANGNPIAGASPESAPVTSGGGDQPGGTAPGVGGAAAPV
jgi:hypothetical protein